MFGYLPFEAQTRARLPKHRSSKKFKVSWQAILESSTLLGGHILLAKSISEQATADLLRSLHPR